MAEVTVSGHPGKDIVVSLVNTSGCFGVSFVDPLPVFHARIALSVGAEPFCVQSLRGGFVSWSYDGGLLELDLECLYDYDALVITLQV